MFAFIDFVSENNNISNLKWIAEKHCIFAWTFVGRWLVVVDYEYDRTEEDG